MKNTIEKLKAFLTADNPRKQAYVKLGVNVSRDIKGKIFNVLSINYCEDGSSGMRLFTGEGSAVINTPSSYVTILNKKRAKKLLQKLIIDEQKTIDVRIKFIKDAFIKLGTPGVIGTPPKPAQVTALVYVKKNATEPEGFSWVNSSEMRGKILEVDTAPYFVSLAAHYKVIYLKHGNTVYVFNRSDCVVVEGEL